MGRRVLSPRGGPARIAEQGFTLVEAMVAMSISVVVLLANVYLINTAHKDLAHAKAITAATNLATNRIADFRAMTIAEINAAAPTVQGDVRRGTDTVTVDGVPFDRTWFVSSIDLDPSTPQADLVGDLVKIKIDVAWVSDVVKVAWTPENSGKHHVTMTTFTTGRTP